MQAINRITVDNLINKIKKNEEVLEEQIFELEITNDIIIKYEQHWLITWKECEEKIQKKKTEACYSVTVNNTDSKRL